MKLIIDIDEETYKMCRQLLGDADGIERAIADGRPLEEKGCDTCVYDFDMESCICSSCMRSALNAWCNYKKYEEDL